MITFYDFVYKIFYKSKLLLWTFYGFDTNVLCHVQFRLLMTVLGPHLETI